ncbi:MAG: DUF3617 family protein [Deltaproteobacteria bacterium]|nr:DUF3617 family protein [Deltaproteobacteria bacterium]
MLRKILVISVVLVASLSTSIAGSGPNMEEGKWEVTTRMEMPGMSISMPEVTSTQCLTKKDFVPQGSQQGQECKITKTKVDGNTVTWTVKCSGQGGEVTGTGKMTYRGSSFKGKIEMTMVQSNTKMISHINGHRIGDCE